MKVRSFLRSARLVAGKDLRDLARNRALVASMALSPVFFFLVFGFAFPGGGAARSVPMGLVVEDPAQRVPPGSLAFVAPLRLENERRGLFAWVDYASAEEARAAIRAGDVRGAILVPAAPPTSDGTPRTRDIVVLFDPTNPALGARVARAAQTLVDAVADQQAIARIRVVANYGTDAAAAGLLQPYRAQAVPLAGAGDSYVQFLAPGLIVLFLVGAVLSGLPSSFAREHDLGTLDGLLVASASRGAIAAGKALALAARGGAQVLATLLVAVVAFGVRLRGDPLLVLALLALALLAFVGVGILVASLARTQETSGAVVGLVYLPLVLLSGVLFPLEQLPGPAAVLGRALPLTHAVQGLRKVMILDAGWTQVAPELLALAAFAAGLLTLALAVFHARAGREA